jgi:plastocyanin
VSNVSGKSFSFSFQGDASGSEGAESFFEARIVKKAGENNYSTTDFELENGLTGTHSVTLNEEEEELYIVIASVPEQFSGFQNFGYSIELVEGTIEQTDQEEPLVESFSIDVTANSSSNYTLIGTDRNGSISGSDPDLLFNVGDTIQFEVNASGHPFYLKTLAGTGTSNTLSGVINNGASNGTVSWTPTTAGTYYYQCALHAGMVGTITVE